MKNILIIVYCLILSGRVTSYSPLIVKKPFSHTYVAKSINIDNETSPLLNEFYQKCFSKDLRKKIYEEKQYNIK